VVAPFIEKGRSVSAGYTIRVTTSSGSGGAAIHEYFDAAIDDKDRAVEAVRIAAKVPDGTPIEVVGELSPVDIGKAGLQPGALLSVRKAIAVSGRQGRAKRR
jgi:hypothetical protein